MERVDHLVRAIDRERHVRVCAAMTTALVADAARRHAATPMVARAVGRALTAGVMLATLTKGDERVTVQLIGDGPIGSITVDASGNGDVRGYALHPEAGAEL
ncbi:MAG TPA: Hsp33 family molecular chaperone HslO, partial [Polyangia bacterium]